MTSLESLWSMKTWGGNFSIRIAEKGNEQGKFVAFARVFESRVYSCEKSREKGSLFRETFTRPTGVHAKYANNIIFLTFLSLNSLPSPFLPGENTDKFLFSRAARLLSVGTLSSVIIKLLLRFYYIARTIVEDEKLNEL